jgi:dephospho-CoA kinase
MRCDHTLTSSPFDVRLGTMKIIILTGTIGSGKSAAARLLEGLGAGVIDSDEVARHVIDPGTDSFQQVVEFFGPGILTAAQSVDSKKLAAMVFNNAAALQKLNHIIHPRVDKEVECLLEKYRVEGKKAVFVEMAFLAEPRWKERVDQVWWVKASRDIALRRLEERGLSQHEALARLANQTGLPESSIKDMVVINNDGDINELREQIVKLWCKIDNESG